MMDNRVYYRGNRAMVRTLIGRVVSALIGQPNEHSRAAQSVFTVVGFSALGSVADDFVRKSDGLVGEDGVKWPPLKPETIAYSRRFVDGEQAALKRGAGLGPGHHHRRSLLSAAQDRKWKWLFVQNLKRYVMSMPEPAAKARAAAAAWTVLKNEGAKTKLMVYGHRQVKILRDTGVLLNSLSQGKIEQNGEYTPPPPIEDEPDHYQIFEMIESGVIVGTTVAYAKYHAKTRPFIPERIPEVWEQRWLEDGTQAISSVLIRAMEGGAA